jgi:hypothetical protein
MSQRPYIHDCGVLAIDSLLIMLLSSAVSSAKVSAGREKIAGCLKGFGRK